MGGAEDCQVGTETLEETQEMKTLTKMILYGVVSLILMIAGFNIIIVNLGIGILLFVEMFLSLYYFLNAATDFLEGKE